MDGAPAEAGGGAWPAVVTGLDILPVLVKALLHMPTDGDMEWWSAAQVSSWMDSLLWVPHHIAGLVCCLLGFLLVWMSKGTSGLPARAVRANRGPRVRQRVWTLHLGCAGVCHGDGGVDAVGARVGARLASARPGASAGGGGCVGGIATISG